MSAPGRPEPGWEAPEGTHHVAYIKPEWRLVTGKRCRRQQRGKKACGQPSVAELNRGRYISFTKPDLRKRDNWWAYCADHMYGNWIEDGHVMGWKVEPDCD